MNETSPDVYAEVFRQLGSISAVLGGLAFAAAAALLATGVGTTNGNALTRSAHVTIIAATSSAATLVFAALTWTLMTVAAVGASGLDQGLPENLAGMHMLASNAFVLGVLLFFVSVGASGWIGARRLGWVTTTIAALVGAASLLVLLRFVD